MPRSSQSPAGSWSASDIMNRYGTSNLKLTYANPAFDIGRVNNTGHLAFQKQKSPEHITTRFQQGDYVIGRRFSDGKKIRGKILSIQNREGFLDRVYILHKGVRTRIDVATMHKLEESSLNSFSGFMKLLESQNPTE